MRPRTVRRYLILFVALVASIYAFFWWMDQKGDIQLASDTSEMLSAIQYTDNGSNVVAVKDDGSVVTPEAGRNPKFTDRDVNWDPAGNRLYFISDRKEASFHIYRWDPVRNGEPEQRSVDKAGRSNLAFDVEPSPINSALVTVRGTVQEFNAKTAESTQVMPPTSKLGASIADEGSGAIGGAGSNMEMLYRRFGVSFRLARWFKKRRYVAAVMRREENGETLLVQDLEPDEKGNQRAPQSIFVAEKFTLEVDSSTGNLLIGIVNLYPTPDENGKMVKPPFRNGLFMLDPTATDQPLKPIIVSPNEQGAVASFKPSPDGQTVLMVLGTSTEEGNINVQGLGTCPLKVGGGQEIKPITGGPVSDPCYSPSGKKIAFARKEGTLRAIYIGDNDGSNLRNLTGDKGDFAHPAFSPQYKDK